MQWVGGGVMVNRPMQLWGLTLAKALEAGDVQL